MRHINIVLCEPEIPQNTGNIARTCAATGASLHLIRPLGFEIDNAKLKRAGLDYWDKLDITYYDSLEQFLEVTKGENLYFFSTKATKMHSEIIYPKRCFLVFGKETAGLPKQLVAENMHRSVRIPMRDELRCLNLSNSVAIGAYEVLRQQGYPGLTNTPTVYN
jgi:tRNA (cytidine/uridine-2'-O-)-methyltransferase